MSHSYTISTEPIERDVECRSDRGHSRCLPTRRGVATSCLHARDLRHLQGAGAGGRGGHQDSSDFALLEFERTEGKAFICVATPLSDVMSKRT